MFSDHERLYTFSGIEVYPEEDIEVFDESQIESVYPNQLSPITTNNPPTVALSLFKELTGFPNYGNPSGNADILYTGNRGEWTFDISPFLFLGGNFRGQLAISAVLDDAARTPANRYSARIIINGSIVHDGRVPLQHGVPFGSQFNNWSTLLFNVPNLRRNNRVVIINTSRAAQDDWIGLDWMDLRLFFSPR